MDSGKIYLYTLYDSVGRRIGMRLIDDAEYLQVLAKRDATAFGCTFKLWECTEVKLGEAVQNNRT